MTIKAGLFRTWSETQKTGSLALGLKFQLFPKILVGQLLHSRKLWKLRLKNCSSKIMFERSCLTTGININCLCMYVCTFLCMVASSGKTNSMLYTQQTSIQMLMLTGPAKYLAFHEM